MMAPTSSISMQRLVELELRMSVWDGKVWCFYFLSFLLSEELPERAAGIFIQGPTFRFFAPHRRIVAPMTVKFGTEEQTTGSLLSAKRKKISTTVFYLMYCRCLPV